MSLLQGLMGNASEIDASQLEQDMKDLLIEGEEVTKAYTLVRDVIIFTDKRLILVDKQGLSGKKREYKTIPYSNISVFSMENAGRFDADSEITLHVRGLSMPLQLSFGRNSSIEEAYRALSKRVLG